MAKRKLFTQEKKNTCAVASLRSVLASQYDVFVKEAVLEALGTDARTPIRIVGCDNAALRRMVKGASFAFNTGKPWRLTIRTRGRVDDLRRQCARGRYPMLTFVSKSESGLHMVVCIDVRPGAVRVFDPEVTKTRWIETSAFLALWTQPDGCREYAVITGGQVCGA